MIDTRRPVRINISDKIRYRIRYRIPPSKSIVFYYDFPVFSNTNKRTQHGVSPSVQLQLGKVFK